MIFSIFMELSSGRKSFAGDRWEKSKLGSKDAGEKDGDDMTKKGHHYIRLLRWNWRQV